MQSLYNTFLKQNPARNQRVVATMSLSQPRYSLSRYMTHQRHARLNSAELVVDNRYYDAENFSCRLLSKHINWFTPPSQLSHAGDTTCLVGRREPSCFPSYNHASVVAFCAVRGVRPKLPCGHGRHVDWCSVELQSTGRQSACGRHFRLWQEHHVRKTRSVSGYCFLPPRTCKGRLECESSGDGLLYFSGAFGRAWQLEQRPCPGDASFRRYCEEHFRPIPATIRTPWQRRHGYRESCCFKRRTSASNSDYNRFSPQLVMVT